MKGYREANSKWTFQVDSDNEMQAKNFPKLWKHRKDYDFLIGIRKDRKQRLTRKVVSVFSEITVKLLYGKETFDVNSPYRLMRSDKFKKIYNKIPRDTFAPNVIISGMAVKKKINIYKIKIPIMKRTTGETSIKKWDLFKAAAQSWWQTVRFAWPIEEKI